MFEIRDFQLGSDIRVKTPELAAMMRGHGSVVVGVNLPTAVARCIYLEMQAKQLLQAMTIAGPGGELVFLDDAEVAAIQARQEYGRPWNLFRTKVLARLAAEGEQ